MSQPAWKQFFTDWPDTVAQRGVLVTSHGDQIPFKGFLMGEGLLLVDRVTPDAAGARQVVVTYEAIEAVKITDVVKPKALEGFGLTGSLSSK